MTCKKWQTFFFLPPKFNNFSNCFSSFRGTSSAWSWVAKSLKVKQTICLMDIHWFIYSFLCHILKYIIAKKKKWITGSVLFMLENLKIFSQLTEKKKKITYFLIYVGSLFLILEISHCVDSIWLTQKLFLVFQ